MDQYIYATEKEEPLRFDCYSLVILSNGSGVLQVDFQNHHFHSGKGIFLSPGQYLKVVSGEFQMSLYEFPGDKVVQLKNSRFLFKHLVSLGHIDVSSRNGLNSTLRVLEIDDRNDDLLHVSISRWIKLNPFNATLPEVELLFDVKDFVDENYKKSPRVDEVANALGATKSYIKNLTRKKLELTVNRLTHRKLLLEAQRKVAFTPESTKSIAYELGFNHPTYFNRYFQQHTKLSPGQFRDHFNLEMHDEFAVDFMHLLENHFREEKFLGFYANKLYLSPKTLSRKIQRSFSCGFNQLLSDKLIEEAKQQLKEENSVTDISFRLGFKEPNHLTSFFKKHTGLTPTAFLN